MILPWLTTQRVRFQLCSTLGLCREIGFHWLLLGSYLYKGHLVVHCVVRKRALINRAV